MLPCNDLRILILADDPLARAGLAALLAQQPGCQVVGQAPADADLAAEIDAAQPDVVLWDLGWTPAPRWSGWPSWAHGCRPCWRCCRAACGQTPGVAGLARRRAWPVATETPQPELSWPLRIAGRGP